MRISRVLLIPVAMLLSFACGEEKASPEPVIRPVRTEAVYATGSARTRTFSGTSQAALESRLSFKVSGTIAKLAVAVGDRVGAGDVIAKIDDRDYRLQVQEAEAALNSAKAQARSAESNYGRVRALYENRNASANDLDAARAASESAGAQVRRSEKAVELSRSQLSYTSLLSPVAGSIASVMVEENENVSPGHVVVLLSSGNQLEVNVAIPEILIAQIREGDDTIVTFDALPGKTFPAAVTEVGVSSAGGGTTFPVLVSLKHTDPACRPGMAAEVEFTFGGADSRPRLIVSAFSVGEDRAGRFVFVAEPSGDGMATAQRRSVTVGELTETGIEIVEGIEDGEQIVTAGVTRIQDGQVVRLLQ